MARILFEIDIDAPASKIVDALNSQDGISGWWTDGVEFAGGVGSTMTLRFSIAPLPFELRVDEVSDQTVRWTNTGEFPPHWADTTITWTLSPLETGGIKVHFNHDGWKTDDGAFPSSALTWAQLQGSLKAHVETGAAEPLFIAN